MQAITWAPPNEAAPKPKTWRRTICKVLCIGLILAVLGGSIAGIVYAMNDESSVSNESNNSSRSHTETSVIYGPTFSPTTVAPTAPTPPTKRPTVSPTKRPTTATPTKQPTRSPTKRPTTQSPTKRPTTAAPTKRPTSSPTKRPTTQRPTKRPTMSPTPNPVLAFNIQLIYTTSMTDEQRQAFEDARIMWESIITQDFASSVILSKGTSLCAQPPLQQDILLDDIGVFVGIENIDGPGNVLAQSGPCAFESATGKIRMGIMRFDSADLAVNFRAVILHEMGHVLGIGSMWDENSLITPVGQTPVLYVGSNGILGHTEIGGTGNPIVEDSGGRGTARAHWKESIYRDELMTGYLSSSGVQPLSRMTIRALQDLGYAVDLSKAENFQISSGSGRRLERDGIHITDEIYSGPFHYFDDGHVIIKKGRHEQYRRDRESHERKRRIGGRKPSKSSSDQASPSEDKHEV